MPGDALPAVGSRDFSRAGPDSRADTRSGNTIGGFACQLVYNHRYVVGARRYRQPETRSQVHGKEFRVRARQLERFAVRGPLFAVQSSALGLTDRQDVPVRTTNAAVNDQHVFTSRLINGFTLGVQRVETRLITDEPQQPLISVTGLTIAVGSRGRSISANTGYHNIRLNQQASAVTVLSYTSLEDFRNNRAAAASVMSGNPGSATWAYQAGLWAQDSWLVHHDLSFDYGLRYDVFGPPFDHKNARALSMYRTGALTAPGTPYFETNCFNLGPRLGMAWQARSYWILACWLRAVLSGVSGRVRRHSREHASRDDHRVGPAIHGTRVPVFSARPAMELQRSLPSPVSSRTSPTYTPNSGI